MYASFDLGGTSLKHGILDEQGNIIEKGKIPVHDDVWAILDLIADQVKKYQEKYEVSGICLSTPGAVDSQTGIIHGYSALPSIHGPNWMKELEKRCALPVSIENDANCAALAEVYAGAGKGYSDLIFVVIGSGIGGAIIKNRRIHHGKHLSGGEFGYAVFQQKDGELLTFSDLAATVNMVQKVQKELEDDSLDGQKIFERARKGDETCSRAVNEFYFQIAVGIYNLQYIYDPEKILLGGGVSDQEDFVEKIKEQIDIVLEKVEIADIKPEIAKCSYGPDANLEGAYIHYKLQNNSLVK